LRKGLLSDLSMLVRIAKQLQEMVQTAEPESSVYSLLDELILKAFKVVERAVRFHDIWNQDVEREAGLEYSSAINRPPTPPVDNADDAQFPASAGIDQPTQGGATFSRTSLHEPEITNDKNGIIHNQIEEEDTGLIGQVSREPTTTNQAPTRPVSIASNRLSVAHRLSYIGKGRTTKRDNLASERLNNAHDSFTSLLGIFLGLHINSRSSHELAATTHRSVIACRQLIAVIEEIWERDGRRQDSLQAARDVMYTRLAELVKTTKDMLTAAQNDDILDSDQGQQLVLTTTNCIRAAGDCVSKARQTIERIGDFEFEADQHVAFSDQVFGALAPAPESVIAEASPEDTPQSISEQPEPTDKPLPIPPEPTARPPPPPQLTLTIDTKPLPEPPTHSPTIPSEPTISALTVHSPDSDAAPLSGSSMASGPFALLYMPAVNGTVGSLSTSQSPSTFNPPPRIDSVNASVASTTNTSAWRTSGTDGASVKSHGSTRATTPEFSQPTNEGDVMNHSFSSISEFQSVASEELALEEQILEKSYAHELILGKDGQILGGSLPALIERLTTHDSTPDATFVTTFWLTFRLFTTPIEFAKGLVERFEYVGSGPAVGLPVRLRIYNTFKGWLEAHWNAETDSDILPIVTDFAHHRLAIVLPSAGTRLIELVGKVMETGTSAITPRIVSVLTKNSASVTSFTSMSFESQFPSPNITKSQINALRASRAGGNQCNILDFDPMELARQLTIIESRPFCSIAPEELLALEWTKKGDTKAVNVRAMSTLSTDLANLVADSILQYEEPKKRAIIIKYWIKIAMKCLELNNFDALMAIICSLNSSMITRLKKTWDYVSTKTKARYDDLCAITDISKNYSVLREKVKDLVAPCIPFVGLYLTDLTFVHVGNSLNRELPGVEPKRYVINFDRYIKTAKTIGQLQRFQVPYKLAPVPELQEWIEAQFQRIRESDASNVQFYYRRSLLLEPRETQQTTQSSRMPWYSSSNNNTQSQFSQPSPPSQDIATFDAANSSQQSIQELPSPNGSKEKFNLFGSFGLSQSSEAKINNSP
jgi:hypothetical protein